MIHSLNAFLSFESSTRKNSIYTIFFSLLLKIEETWNKKYKINNNNIYSIVNMKTHNSTTECKMWNKNRNRSE